MNWHVTVRFFGDAEPSDVVASLADVTLPAATAALGPVVRRLGPSTVVVPVAGLDDLAAAVGAAIGGIGMPPGPRPFDGHLTLARLRRGTTTCDLTGTPVAAEFRVDEIVLVRSELSRAGAAYDVIGRWSTG
jgi:2'-5' RNA ligase